MCGCTLIDNAFAYHGQEIQLKIDYAHYLSLLNLNKQVKVLVSYTTNDTSVTEQPINAVMKIYSINGTIIKTSSYPEGFMVNNTGIVEIKTGINDPTAKELTAVVQFTDIGKTIPLSNPIPIKLTFGQIIK